MVEKWIFIQMLDLHTFYKFQNSPKNSPQILTFDIKITPINKQLTIKKNEIEHKNIGTFNPLETT